MGGTKNAKLKYIFEAWTFGRIRKKVLKTVLISLATSACPSVHMKQFENLYTNMSTHPYGGSNRATAILHAFLRASQA
jgi:hypothetical protein